MTARAGDRFRLRALDADRDLDLLHAWMNDPEVARFWEMAWPREHIARYLAEHPAHSQPRIGLLDEAPMSYWELYRADEDPLATHYPARAHDAGLHLLLGPPACRGRGWAADLLRAVAGWQLEADPDATRVLAEPDVRNVRSIRAFERAGFRRDVDLALPDKHAALMIRERR